MFGGCYAVKVFMILSDETFRPLTLLVFHQLQEMYPTTPFFFSGDRRFNSSLTQNFFSHYHLTRIEKLTFCNAIPLPQK